MSYLPVKNTGDEDKNKNKSNFEIFFRDTYEPLCSYAFRYVSSRKVAEDIVQSSFLSVWEKKNLWDDFESAKAYMYKTVRNKALNHKKHEQVKKESQSDLQFFFNEWKEFNNSNNSVEKKVKVIRKGIQELPERRREIFKLSRENGLTYREIANTLDISIKTVETQIGRSLKFLRSFVAEYNFVFLFYVLISV